MIQIRLRERDDIDHLRTTVGQLAHALSALGQVTADATPAPDNDTSRASAGDGQPVVMMPPGLVNRATRYLELAAVLVTTACCPRTSTPRTRSSWATPSNRTP